MQRDAKAESFWRAFLASVPLAPAADRRFYEVFSIGATPAGADEGARLIKQGVKTATSSLLWTYDLTRQPLPAPGALSIVIDGRAEPVCVVETTVVEIKALSEVDAAFAYDYGEWDRTLATWRAQCWAAYASECQALGKTPTPDLPLVCERFVVIYP